MEELCANTDNERSIVGRIDLWNILFFIVFFVQCVLSDVYCSKEGFYTERRKCFSMTFLLAVVNRSGIPAELIGSFLLINILCTLTRIGDCTKCGNTSVRAKTILNRAR